jgi:hypothetical protein
VQPNAAESPSLPKAGRYDNKLGRRTFTLVVLGQFAEAALR